MRSICWAVRSSCAPRIGFWSLITGEAVDVMARANAALSRDLKSMLGFPVGYRYCAEDA